ncbi:hypothetical protein PENTCL1PPCAC_9542, partial [Pristionchus entomophagus]
RSKFTRRSKIIRRSKCRPSSVGRSNGWIEPSFFGRIVCDEKMVDKARDRLEKEKMGRRAMSEKEKDEVCINVWIGMYVLRKVKFEGMTEYPRKFNWMVRALADSDFIHDLLLDVA